MEIPRIVHYTKREPSREVQALKEKKRMLRSCREQSQSHHYNSNSGETYTKTIFKSFIRMAVGHHKIHSINHSLTLSPCETQLCH